MMATTHAFVGAAVATLSAFIAPEVTPAAVAAGFAGGVVPDFDVAFEHRRTLHFPVLAPLAAVPVVVLAVLAPGPGSVPLAAFAVGFALHPVADHFGGSTELRPWERTTDRAVYSHVGGRWLPARRWIRYDGSVEDLCFGAVASVPMLVVTDGHLRTVALAALGVSLGYTVLRKRLFELYDALVRYLPSTVAAWAPGQESTVGTDDVDRDVEYERDG